MKRLLKYSLFESNTPDIKEEWFRAIYKNYVHKVPILIDASVDINMRFTKYNNKNALMLAAELQCDFIVTLLIQCKNIDAAHKDNNGETFIDKIRGGKRYILDSYRLQKNIMENGRDDILILFNDYKLLNDSIKKEYPYLGYATDMNLI